MQMELLVWGDVATKFKFEDLNAPVGRDGWPSLPVMIDA